MVTDLDIVGALAKCNMIKERSLPVYILGIRNFASSKAVTGWLTLEPSARLRREASVGSECCRWMARI
jgi:hypothetical protein